MSKYVVNKFMRLVNAEEWALKEYVSGPPAFVEQWAAQDAQHRLSEHECRALAERDYAKLYELGAHPFLLWSFTQAVWEHEVDREELIRDYKEKTARVGYPDFRT